MTDSTAMWRLLNAKHFLFPFFLKDMGKQAVEHAVQICTVHHDISYFILFDQMWDFIIKDSTIHCIIRHLKRRLQKLSMPHLKISYSDIIHFSHPVISLYRLLFFLIIPLQTYSTIYYSALQGKSLFLSYRKSAF